MQKEITGYPRFIPKKIPVSLWIKGAEWETDCGEAE
jgi:hypothetical protein